MKKYRDCLSSLICLVALVTGCGSEPVDNAEFLEEVRDSAKAIPVESSESGLIDPGVESPPSIEFPGLEFDMGTIPAEGFTFKEMPIYNRGGAPLVIEDVTTSCPCTTGKMKEKTIPAGGIGTLVIKLDPDKVSGFRSRKRLTIRSNDPKTPLTYLIVTAEVEGALILSSKEIVFGTVDVDKAVEQSILLTQTQSAPVVIENIQLDGAPDFLTLEITKTTEDTWKTPAIPEWDITARISEESVSGRYNVISRISIISGRKQRMNIPIKFTVKGLYGFEPYDITVRNLVPGELQEGVTVLSSSTTLEVTGVKSNNPNMKVSYSLATEPNTYRFDLLMPERPENRLQKDEWEVTMLVDGKEVVEVIKVVALMSRL